MPPSLPPSITTDASSRQPSRSPQISYHSSLLQKHYHKNAQAEKGQFEEKMQRSLQETADLTQMCTEELLIAVAPNSNYCQICRERFDDYFTHITIKTHIIRTAQSEVSEKIRALCGEFQERGLGGVMKEKSKLIKK